MSLPSWLEPLPDAEAMRVIDAWAIEDAGVPSLGLMERAGQGLAGLAAERAREGHVAVVCGKGNNGGDGLVAARLLRAEGREVRVLCACDPTQLRGDAAANLERLPPPAPEPFAPYELQGAGLVVDALLGTGFSGSVRDELAGVIEAIGACGAPVVAADVPSGVDASSGRVDGVAVRAAATATFHAAKPGLYVSPGKACAGDVRVIDIGIPRGAPVAAATGLIVERVLAEIPARHPGSTKFSEGAVLVIGGSAGLTGAPCLAAEGAARAGAGYVTVAVPASLSLVFELRLLEAMSRCLPDRDGALTQEGLEPALAAAERADAIAVGPGIGRNEGTVELVRELARRVERPLLLDADGLNAHAEHLGDLRARRAPTVLTPHGGELGRLLGVGSDVVAAERLRYVREAAVASGAVVVLKGDDTLVAEAGGRVAASAGGSAALATAGTGDVLSGVVAAMLAKGLDAFTAACAGVALHGAAGRLAAARHGANTVIARDVIEALPEARGRAG